MNKTDKEILRLALPSIVSNITVPLLGLVDVAITGHLGAASYIGAIAVGGMLFNIIYWMFAFLRMGTSGMVAQAYGSGDAAQTSRLLRRAMAISIGISATILVLQVPIRELTLWLIAPEPEVLGHTRTYFNICIWGAPASLSLFSLTGWFVGMQDTRSPMAVAILQNVLNIAVSLLLVYGMDMGIEGVALGTLIAQWGGLFTALLLMHAIKRPVPQRSATASPSADDTTPSGNNGAFAIYRDIFLRTLCLVAIHFLFISAGARIGTVELAVNTVLMQFFTMYSYIMDGFAFAGEAMVGKAVGARDGNALANTVRRLFAWGVIMTTAFTLVYAVAESPFISLLTDDATVRQAAATYQWWALLFPVCGMAAFIWDGIYIGATATRGMLVSMSVSLVVFLLGWQLLIPLWGNHGLWASYVAYLAMRGTVQTILQKKHIRI